MSGTSTRRQGATVLRCEALPVKNHGPHEHDEVDHTRQGRRTQVANYKKGKLAAFQLR